jgi:hypothetical protein
MTLEELLKECNKHGINVTLPPSTKTFDVIVRYNRGLGPEYVNLDSVAASTIKDAQNIAQIQANELLKYPGMEKAIINEVKIRPIKESLNRQTEAHKVSRLQMKDSC